MPVTVPLSLRRGAGRYRTAATRAVAVTAVVGASLTALAAADPHEAHTLTGNSVANAATETDIPVAFTPREAQMPQVVPQQVLDFLNGLRAEQNRPKTVRPSDGPLSSGFGMRWGAMHAGIDFAGMFGSPIRSVTDGTVIEAGPASGFGLWVRVLQDDGTIGVYGHMQDILVQVGQQLKAGDVLATVGNRGYSTGPHLHYEVHAGEGAAIDPLPWLAGRGMNLGPAAD
ncbi:peptidoglycan DD-metalloendopeptidase family protein [Nocardia sp. ET3-3]|uniref:Peptidoglycan DD-metalloendopeptidase family protein n=1 Tax=Nocardia terrae TaxID=2675851 RepID=A0A7K1V7P0_9NOCA|nr:M23 family metallopeptidase [Nocardia terrae]MVU82664.1 peptidoglycan DD-metalloendopeptidase family protein [Nocardia terrae]